MFARPESARGEESGGFGASVASFAYELGASFVEAVDREQLVPQVGSLMRGQGRGMVLFPTLLVETGRLPSVGARMIAGNGPVQTLARLGLGGPRDHVVEGKLRLGRGLRPALSGGLEALFESRSGLQYHGLGPRPREDERNHFLGDFAYGSYVSRRSRALGFLTWRPGARSEWQAASNLLRAHISDDPEEGARALERVFAARDLQSSLGTTTTAYAELAFRFDTRRHPGRPSQGLLGEAYLGRGRGLGRTPSRFTRSGGRLGADLELGRPTRLLAPRLSPDVLDVLDVRGPETPLPFYEYVGPSELRSAWRHRDLVSACASLDYAWMPLEPLGTRAFLELSSVAPKVLAPELARPQLGGGVGLSVYGRTAELGRLDLALSSEGLRVRLSIGLQRGFGDRLRREP